MIRLIFPISKSELAPKVKANKRIISKLNKKLNYVCIIDCEKESLGKLFSKSRLSEY